MALPPNIPTSFVPKQPVQTPRRKQSVVGNLFLIVSLAIAGVALVAAAGTLAYVQFLTHVEGVKAAELQQQQDAVNVDTVRDYIRLKDRLNSGRMLLETHVTLSNFFDELEALTLQNVQFTSLDLAVAGDGSAKVTLGGVARNFNALAVQSNMVASNKLIKRAIFSDIAFDTTANTSRIKFTLTADLDAKLIQGGMDMMPALPEPLPAAPTATTTP